MTTRRTMIALWALSFVGLTSAAQASTIGFNFTDNNSPTFSGQIAGTAQPGVVAGANWNNVGPVGTNQSGRNLVADIIGPVADTIVDNSGAGVAGITATYDYGNAASFAGAPSNEFQEMMRYGINGNNTAETAVQISGIPYNYYDVYVYVGSLTTNHTMEVTVGATTFYYRGDNDTSPSLITSTISGSPTLAGNYVVFKGLNTSILNIAFDGSISGTTATTLKGIHIVAVPEPSTLALGLLGLGMVALGRRRRR